MKTYGYGLAVLAVAAVGWGVVAPRLVSAPSDVAVALGFVVAAAVPLMLFGICRTWSVTSDGQKIIRKIKEIINA